MIKLPSKVLKVLRELDITVDLKEHSEDVKIMHKNNMKRSGGRNADMVLEHTRRGYGAELALIQTGLFTSAAPLVENADTEMSFADRMRDLYYDGHAISVKTTKHNYRYFYITDTQYKSIKYTQKFCDLAMIMSAEDLGDGVFRYRSLYLVDNKKIHQYIKYPPVPTPWHSRVFMANMAVEDGGCISFKEEKVNAKTSAGRQSKPEVASVGKPTRKPRSTTPRGTAST